MTQLRNVTIKDGCGTDQLACVESNGGISSNIQDQHSRMLDLKFLSADPGNFTTLTADTAVDDYVISVAQTTGMVAGVTTIGLTDASGIFYFGEVVSINVLDVTLDTRIDNIFPSATTNVIVADGHMNVVGTMANPVIFQIGGVGAATGLEIDITRVLGNMTDDVIMYDELFGGRAALTNGIALRQVNGETINIWNLKSNGDIALMCYDATYPDKLPSGSYAFRFRNSFAGQAKHGVTIRLEAGDTLELLIQDDLSSLVDFQMIAQGHLVTN